MKQQNSMIELISQWRISGMTKVAFCREQQISLHQFNYWLKKNSKAKDSNANDNELRFFSVETPSSKKNPVKTNIKSTLLVELPNGIKLNFY